MPESKKGKTRKAKSAVEMTDDAEAPSETSAVSCHSLHFQHTHCSHPSPRQQQHRKRLLKELAARLTRDKHLRYTEREFEMQRLMMGRGAHRKLRGVEKVEGPDDEGEDEDEEDSMRKRRPKRTMANEKTYRPRVYKWRLERKR
jgi:U3 small nucleolar RNA-associated protein 11